MYPFNFGAERALDLESKDLGFESCQDCRLAVIYRCIINAAVPQFSHLQNDNTNCKTIAMVK